MQWGNLAATHDSVGVDRLADFYHRRLVYHLTDAGEAAHRAIAQVERTIGRSGSLQTTMLGRIRDTLATLADGTDRSPDQAYGLVHEVTSAFDTLTHEANRFVTDLGRLTGEDRDAGVSDERFAAIKTAVLTYIQRFVDELRRVADDIRHTVRALDGDQIGSVLEVASRSADLPDFDGEGTARQQWQTEQQRRWAGIAAWFTGDTHEPATVDRLADFAVGAVLTLTRTLGRLNDQRARTHGRTEDFLTLAQWFADCDDDQQAHELWHAAFGLHGARHLQISEEDPGLISARTSWWDAEPVRVPTRLRTHGRVSRTGRTPRAADHSEERRFLAARARRERAQVEAAIARFAGQQLRVSDLIELDAHEFDLLLSLLDTALVAHAPTTAAARPGPPTAALRWRSSRPTTAPSARWRPAPVGFGARTTAWRWSTSRNTPVRPGPHPVPLRRAVVPAPSLLSAVVACTEVARERRRARCGARPRGRPGASDGGPPPAGPSVDRAA